MPYRYIPDSDRYGGYNKEEALKKSELPPWRDLRGDRDRERPSVERSGFTCEKELEGELPPWREPRSGETDD